MSLNQALVCFRCIVSALGLRDNCACLPVRSGICFLSFCDSPHLVPFVKTRHLGGAHISSAAPQSQDALHSSRDPSQLWGQDAGVRSWARPCLHLLKPPECIYLVCCCEGAAPVLRSFIEKRLSMGRCRCSASVGGGGSRPSCAAIPNSALSSLSWFLSRVPLPRPLQVFIAMIWITSRVLGARVASVSPWLCRSPAEWSGPPGSLLTGRLVLYQSCGFVHLHERRLLWPSKQSIAFLLTTLRLFENLFHHLFLTAYLNSTAFLHIVYDPDKSISWVFLSIPFRYPLLEKME